jgi:hypothetical protein
MLMATLEERGLRMALIGILCVAALMMTAVDIIAGVRAAQLRPIRLRARDPGARGR